MIYNIKQFYFGVQKMFFKIVTLLVSSLICCVVLASFLVIGGDSVLGGSNYIYSKKIENDISLMESVVGEMIESGKDVNIGSIVRAGYFEKYPTILGKGHYKMSSDGKLISATINRKDNIINDSVCYLINKKDNVKIIRFEMNMGESEKRGVFMDSMREIYPKRRSCSIITYFTRGVDGKAVVNTDYLIASFSTSESMKKYLGGIK